MKWIVTDRTHGAPGALLRDPERRPSPTAWWITRAQLALLCLLAAMPARTDAPPSLSHIHGLAFSVDGPLQESCRAHGDCAGHASRIVSRDQDFKQAIYLTA